MRALIYIHSLVRDGVAGNFQRKGCDLLKQYLFSIHVPSSDRVLGIYLTLSSYIWPKSQKFLFELVRQQGIRRAVQGNQVFIRGFCW